MVNYVNFLNVLFIMYIVYLSYNVILVWEIFVGIILINILRIYSFYEKLYILLDFEFLLCGIFIII